MCYARVATILLTQECLSVIWVPLKYNISKIRQCTPYKREMPKYKIIKMTYLASLNVCFFLIQIIFTVIWSCQSTENQKTTTKELKKGLSWLKGHISCLHTTWSVSCFFRLQVCIWQFCFRNTYKNKVFQQRSWTENAWAHRKLLCLTEQQM